MSTETYYGPDTHVMRESTSTEAPIGEGEVLTQVSFLFEKVDLLTRALFELESTLNPVLSEKYEELPLSEVDGREYITPLGRTLGDLNYKYSELHLRVREIIKRVSL